jgi:hypothetical protein
MKKIIYIITIFAFLQTVSFAYKLEEVQSSDSYVSQFNIISDVTDNIYYGVQVRLNITGGEFISYTQGNLLEIGACENNKFHTEKQICVDIVKDAPIDNNEMLGSFEVKWDTNSEVNDISIAENSAYFDDNIKKELDKTSLFRNEIKKESYVEIILLVMVLFTILIYLFILHKDKNKLNSNGTKVVVLVLILLLPSSIFVEKFYPMPSGMPNLPDTGVSTTTFNKKVLVVIYNPTMASGKKLNVERGWADPTTLSNNLKTWFSNTSSGRVNYQLTFQTINDFPILEGNQKYTSATYLSCLSNSANCKHTGTNDWLDFDYPKFFADNQVCSKANSGSIDEVWIWGGPYFGYWESTLLGPQSKVFWYNSSGFVNSACSKLVPIMGFNYERGYELALESYGHRTESTMNKLYGDINNTNPVTNWDKFVFRLKSGNTNAMNGAYGCGNIHYTANSTTEYNYASSNSVKTYCETFLNYPNVSSSTANQVSINSAAWGSNQLGYFTYWFKHIPNKSGCGPDKKSNDWWKFIIDPNNVFLSENINCVPSPTSTITPTFTRTKTPTPTATKTKTPTPSKTNTPVPTKTATPIPATKTPIPNTKTPIPSKTNTPVPTKTPTKVPNTATTKPTNTVKPSVTLTLTNTSTPITTLIATNTTTPNLTITASDITPTISISVSVTASYTPTLTPTIDLGPIDCGPLDENDDGKLNLFDFIPFSKVYQKQCKDNYPPTGCGAKDSNADGKINIMDFMYFAKHYYTRVDSCKID